VVEEKHPLIPLVEDAEVGGETRERCVLAQDPLAHGVIGRDPRVEGGVADPVERPVEHLLGCLVGEGEHEELTRALDDPLGDEVGDAAGDDRRLSRSDPGQDEERSPAVGDRSPLFLGEPAQDVRHPHECIRPATPLCSYPLEPTASRGYPCPMNPFNLFLVLALVGTILAAGVVVISECRDAELVALSATVTDKAIVVREKTVTTTVPSGGCSTCPGSGSGGSTTVTSVVQEETFFVTLDVVEDGAVSPQRVEVSEALYRKLKVGDAVEWRVLRGKASGRLCSRPEILIPEPVP